MMNRRGFLSAVIVGAAAPAIVRASSLMRITPISGDWVQEDVDKLLLRPTDQLLMRPTTLITPAVMAQAFLKMFNQAAQQSYRIYRENT